MKSKDFSHYYKKRHKNVNNIKVKIVNYSNKLRFYNKYKNNQNNKNK